ncbi:MAG: hypothetical protein ACTS6H_02895 [Candidatus Hodgkinia cicadicola]
MASSPRFASSLSNTSANPEDEQIYSKILIIMIDNSIETNMITSYWMRCVYMKQN